MTTRKKNPAPPRATKKDKRTVRIEKYVQRVKALRKLNRGFGAKDGYNIRDIRAGKFPSARKAKVNRYINEQAAELAAIDTNRAVVKRYRRRDRLEFAILESQQERVMPQQKAAVFVTDYPEETVITIRETKAEGPRLIQFERDQELARLRFSDLPGDTGTYWDEFLLEDATSLTLDVLELFDPEFTHFRIMMGKYQSTTLYPREEVIEGINELVNQYGEDSSGWLTGLIGFTS